MLSEPLRLPGLSDDEIVTLNLNVEQLVGLERRNRKRSDYYDGKRAVRQIGSVIPPQYENIALALGWAAKGVDGLARRCHLDRFIWTGGDLGSLGMQALADSNFLFAEISQGMTDSLLHGVSFLITTQGDESKGEPAVLVHAKDALSATGQWNDRTRRLDSLLSVTARENDQITGLVLYLDGVTINADKVDGKWQVDRSAHAWGVPAEPLVYRPRSSRRMGRSRMTRPLMAYQDMALRALVRLEAHMDIYAIPKMILLGADEGIFKNADGTPKSSWQVVFGRIFGIPDDDDAQQPRADVKQFSAESPEPHIAELNALAKMSARETDLPDTDFALTDLANPTSADAYSASRENLIAEAEGAMDDWSVPLRRTVTRALAMQNGLSAVPDDWAGIDTKWRSPIYLSKSQAADAGAKQLALAPELAGTELGYELLGFDEQQVQRAIVEARRNAGRQVVAALTQRRAPDANVA